MSAARSTCNFFLALIAQGMKFGLVGGVATAVHLTLFILCIELFGMQAFWANFPAFGFALIVGFAGHFLWSFRRQGADGRHSWPRALAKFAVAAVFGLLLNSLIVYGVVDAFGLAYGYAAVLMATVTPAAIFVISKWWVFA